MQKARSSAPEFKQLYHARKQHLLEERVYMQSKQVALMRLQEKALKAKAKKRSRLKLSVDEVTQKLVMPSPTSNAANQESLIGKGLCWVRTVVLQSNPKSCTRY